MITWSLKIISDSFLTILALLILSSFGRAIQLEGFGEISKVTYVLIEIPVEGSRIFLLFILIGNGNLKKGYSTMKKIFHEEWNRIFTYIMKGIKQNYKDLLLWIVLFVLASVAINYWILNVSKNQYIISWIKQFSFINESFNTITLKLFLKNLTIIPLTFFFEVWFFQRIFNNA